MGAEILQPDNNEGKRSIPLLLNLSPSLKGITGDRLLTFRSETWKRSSKGRPRRSLRLREKRGRDDVKMNDPKHYILYWKTTESKE